MPLYMDIHRHVDGLTAEAVAHAHQADLKTQQKYGVNYLRYWFDEGSGKVFCLVEAPTQEAAIAVHREAHGLVADEIIEVTEGS
jgi:peptidyl-tRNA hydrolase